MNVDLVVSQRRIYPFEGALYADIVGRMALKGLDTV